MKFFIPNVKHLDSFGKVIVSLYFVPWWIHSSTEFTLTTVTCSENLTALQTELVSTHCLLSLPARNFILFPFLLVCLFLLCLRTGARGEKSCDQQLHIANIGFSYNTEIPLHGYSHFSNPLEIQFLFQVLLILSSVRLLPLSQPGFHRRQSPPPPDTPSCWLLSSSSPALFATALKLSHWLWINFQVAAL